MSTEYLLPFQREGLSRVETALEEVSAGGNSQGFMVLGGAGSGKTHLMDFLAGRHPPEIMGHQRRVPCCRVAADAQASASSIAAALLVQLGIPLHVSSGWKPKQLEAALHDAIRTCGVIMVILEELHNALLASTNQLRGRLSLFIKNLWNLDPPDTPLNWARPDVERRDRKLVIVASGTDELLEVFDKRAELKSRFSGRIRAPKLAFDPPESFKAYRGVLHAMVRRFALEDHMSANDNEVATRTLIACDGDLRVLESLLRRAATLQRRSMQPPLELLVQAYEEVGGGVSAASNPFRWPTAEIAARIKRARINQRAGNGSERDEANAP